MKRDGRCGEEGPRGGQEEAGIIDELIQRETDGGGGGEAVVSELREDLAMQPEIRAEKCRRNARTSPHLHDRRRESKMIGLSPTKTGI